MLDPEVRRASIRLGWAGLATVLALLAAGTVVILLNVQDQGQYLVPGVPEDWRTGTLALAVAAFAVLLLGGVALLSLAFLCLPIVVAAAVIAAVLQGHRGYPPSPGIAPPAAREYIQGRRP